MHASPECFAPLAGGGSLYARGQGVAQDYAAAAAWSAKAADQGDATAQYNLGIMYARGLGVPRDYVQAHKWFSLANSRYDASDNENRESADNNRDAVAAKMTPAQIAEVEKLAREWKPRPEASRQ